MKNRGESEGLEELERVIMNNELTRIIKKYTVNFYKVVIKNAILELIVIIMLECYFIINSLR